MNQLKNVKGEYVDAPTVTRELLTQMNDRIMEKVKQLDNVHAALVSGSVAYSEPDAYSDLDLDFVADDTELATREIEAILDEMGAERDDDAHTIHFPLDYPARILNGLYLEFDVVKLADWKSDVERVAKGEGLDDARIHSLRSGIISFDKTGELTALREQCLTMPYPKAYEKWITDIGLKCEMKILRQAVAREDWQEAMEWLVKTSMCCSRILLAKNGRYFPGYKRMYTRTIPSLKHQPEGYVEFWQSVLSGNINDWECIVDKAQQYVSELKGY